VLGGNLFLSLRSQAQGTSLCSRLSRQSYLPSPLGLSHGRNAHGKGDNSTAVSIMFPRIFYVWYRYWICRWACIADTGVVGSLRPQAHFLSDNDACLSVTCSLVAASVAVLVLCTLCILVLVSVSVCPRSEIPASNLRPHCCPIAP
jgi:hypothetical protein